MTFWSIVRQRCWGLLLVVAGVCIITFIISHMIPGDPARLLAGDRASDDIVQNIRQQLGLDQPALTRYWQWISGLLHGDMGVPHQRVGARTGSGMGHAQAKAQCSSRHGAQPGAVQL